MQESVFVYYGDGLRQYGFGQDHPFGPDRIDAFWREMQHEGLDKQVLIHEPASCTKEDLLLFHTPEYIEKLFTLSQSGEGYLDYGDTPAFEGVYEAASFVAGSVLDALGKIIDGPIRRGFVPIAGLHHARRDQAEGFCAVNDVGIAIEWLLMKDFKKIGYVDIDAHHGDGVYYGFEDDPRVIFADIHEDGRYLFPGTGDSSETGSGEAKGKKLNLPMESGSDDEAFYRVWDEVEAFMEKHEPEIFILQAGADSIKGDPITHLSYSPRAHSHATSRLCYLADKHAQGRLLALGGGGYNRENLAKSWTEVVKTMLRHQK